MSEGKSKLITTDTSVFIQRPKDCIESFGRNDVVTPFIVLEELDSLKNKNGKAHLAREAIRQIDRYAQLGSLYQGVPTPSGGTFRVEFRLKNLKKLPFGLERTPDNMILATAVGLRDNEARKSQTERRRVILVSRDVNLRIKTNAVNTSNDKLLVEAQDYTSDKLVNFSDTLYQGVAEVSFNEERTDILSGLYRAPLPLDLVEQHSDLSEELFPNECVILTLPSGKSAYAIFRKEHAQFTVVQQPENIHLRSSRSIKPRSPEQAFALALLLDPSVKIVSLVGKTGSGKTLLAVAAGYELLEDVYKRILVYRPMVSVGRPMGYLPGDSDDKMGPWKEPIYEALELVTEGVQKDKGDAHLHKREENYGPRYYADELERRNQLKVAPISFERGASRHNQFIIIDEAQNLTPHEVHTLMTRVGENSKVVITGDPTQIDDPYLDASSCGLVHAVTRFTGQQVYGHLCLKKSERSSIAELSAQLLS